MERELTTTELKEISRIVTEIFLDSSKETDDQNLNVFDRSEIIPHLVLKSQSLAQLAELVAADSELRTILNRDALQGYDWSISLPKPEVCVPIGQTIPMTGKREHGTATEGEQTLGEDVIEGVKKYQEVATNAREKKDIYYKVSRRLAALKYYQHNPLSEVVDSLLKIVDERIEQRVNFKCTTIVEPVSLKQSPITGTGETGVAGLSQEQQAPVDTTVEVEKTEASAVLKDIRE